MNYSFINKCPPQEVVFGATGRYKIEVWGARGGGTLGGLGAYSSGILDVSKPFRAFLFVGGAGSVTAGGCNGGGNGGTGVGGFGNGGGGGGSTDLRLYNDNSQKALASRIIVAGGGGGYGAGCGGSASDAGGITSNPSTGGSASSPGVQGKGSLLYGENGLNGVYVDYQYEGKGAGGGGYIGGHSSGNYYKSSGSGGTSYIAPTLFDPIFLTGKNVPEQEANGKARITFLGNAYHTRQIKRLLPLEILWLLGIST